MAEQFREVTESIAKSICEAVIDTAILQQLKINLANGTEIPFYKQFFVYFKNHYLKDSLEETIIKASSIYDYAMQEALKYIAGKTQKDKLNSPVSFFNINTNDLTGSNTTGAIAVGDNTTTNKGLKLNYSKNTNTNIGTATAISRSGNSQINEDYKNLESYWRKEDNKYESLKLDANKQSFDINIPTNLEDLKLNQIVTESDSLKLEKAPEILEEHQELPEISYTGIGLSKNKSVNINKSEVANKNLAVDSSTGTNKSNSVNTSVQTNKSNTTNLTFVYGDAVYKALGLYLPNFKEGLLSSFSSLFIEPWTGYS